MPCASVSDAEGPGQRVCISLLPHWLLSLAFMAQQSTLNEPTVGKNCLPLSHCFPHMFTAYSGKFSTIKSEYDNFNGLIQTNSQLFMNMLLLTPETRNHMSNQRFLADIQPGAAPLMIITRRLNTYNIMLNFNTQLGSLYYHNSYALISIKSPSAPSHLFLSPICIMVQHHFMLMLCISGYSDITL